MTVLALALFALLSAVSNPVAAQKMGRGNYNFLDFNSKDYYFGITLAYNQSSYRVFRSKYFLPSVNDSIASVESVSGPGFNLAIVSNLKIGDYFDVRFLPGFSFAERNVEYTSTRRNGVIAPKKIESVFVELPFHVRYKSMPYNDKRYFVTGGVKYSFDIQSKSRARLIANNLRVSPTDFQAEVGVGIQMFFPYFIFSPELKVSHGLGNILIFQNGMRESSVIEKLMSRTITLSLHFEG